MLRIEGERRGSNRSMTPRLKLFSSKNDLFSSTSKPIQLRISQTGPIREKFELMYIVQG